MKEAEAREKKNKKKEKQKKSRSPPPPSSACPSPLAAAISIFSPMTRQPACCQIRDIGTEGKKKAPFSVCSDGAAGIKSFFFATVQPFLSKNSLLCFSVSSPFLFPLPFSSANLGDFLESTTPAPCPSRINPNNLPRPRDCLMTSLAECRWKGRHFSGPSVAQKRARLAALWGFFLFFPSLPACLPRRGCVSPSVDVRATLNPFSKS